MSMSQVPTSAAIRCIALSSVMSAGKVKQVVLLKLACRASFVSASVDSVRPIRTRPLAPATAKAMAVSRPIPLPLVHDLSELLEISVVQERSLQHQ